jgi:Predicted pPIWI-associating nuclease
MREDELAAVNKKHRNEEIGAKLELALADFDARLLELRRQAWRNLAGGDVSGARLGMAGIRELFTDVLHALAPDSAVKMTAQWGARSKGITRPTRRMRLDYVLGDDAASDADALLQFSDSVNRAQRFVHTFADDVELVRIQMALMESWIYLLLIRSRGRRRSN